MMEITIAQMAALMAAGIFFLTGLLTGVWKYWQMHLYGRDHYYVAIAHRASLMYAFAAVVLERLAAYSSWPDLVNLWAVLASCLFFALAIGTYVMHGALKDTTNQLKRPHKLGSYHLPTWLVMGFMLSLIMAEVGGFLVLFTGAIHGFWG